MTENMDRTPYVQNSPELQADFITRQIINKNINTCDWVRVVAVDTVKQTVDVKPLVTQLAANNETIDHNIIHGLSYFRYQASIAAVIIDPVINDMGLCIYAQNDVTGVQETKTESPPTSYRTFDYSDGCFIGLVAAIAPTPTTFVRLKDDEILLKIGADTTIKMVDGEISLNATSIKINGAVDFTGTITSNGKTIDDTHTHGGVTTGGGSTSVVD